MSIITSQFRVLFLAPIFTLLAVYHLTINWNSNFLIHTSLFVFFSVTLLFISAQNINFLWSFLQWQVSLVIGSSFFYKQLNCRSQKVNKFLFNLCRYKMSASNNEGRQFNLFAAFFLIIILNWSGFSQECIVMQMSCEKKVC